MLWLYLQFCMDVKCRRCRDNMHKSRLQALEMRYVRRMEGVTQLDKVKNEVIRRALRQDAVLDVVKAGKKFGEETRKEIKPMIKPKID